ncbi:MAG: TetR/AcrR family transcriptional regulator [Pseudomonadota bacterium]
MPSTRLTPEKWLKAGFEALQSLGPQALAAEPLARALGTTKGSFYWHFKDVPSYQDALLNEWRKAALSNVVTLLQQQEEPDQRLRRFGRSILNDPVEANLRIWARTDPRVAQILSEIDAERRKYLTRLLAQLGLSNPDFARALQAALIGLPQLTPHEDADHAAPFDTLVDTVCALSR